MSEFKVGDLVEVIDKDSIYGCSDLNWILPRVVRVNGNRVYIDVDGGIYEFHENELKLHN